MQEKGELPMGENQKLNKMPNQFSTEFMIFEREKQQLSKSHKGKFVLIKGEDIIKIFDDELDAIKHGIEKFGDEFFLVNEITDEDFTVHFVPHIIYR